MSIFKKSRLVLLMNFIVLVHMNVYAQLVSIHIGINITGQSLTDEIKALQNKISDAALENGYLFDTDLKNDFHITLAKIPISNYNDIVVCKKCLEKVARSTNQFDLTEELQKGEFSIFPQKTQAWGAWSLATETNDKLSELVNSVEKCLIDAGLKVKAYAPYRPHISLGTFKEPIQHIPSWIQPLSLKRLDKNPLIIKKLSLSINIKDKRGLRRKFERDFSLVTKLEKPSKTTQQAAAQLKVNKDVGATPLMKAIYDDELSKALHLIKIGVDVNAQDKRGWAALVVAARFGHADLVESLINLGADPNVRSKYGRTALMYAVALGRTDIVKLLIAAGADVNAQDKLGWTALMVAARIGRTSLAKLLIEAGADVNAKGNSGWTVFMEAVHHNNRALVQLLIAAKVDLNAKNKSGNTALNLAVLGGNKNIENEIRIALEEIQQKSRVYLQQQEDQQKIAATQVSQEVAPISSSKGFGSSCFIM